MSLTTISGVTVVIGWIGFIVGNRRDRATMKARAAWDADDRRHARELARGLAILGEAVDRPA